MTLEAVSHSALAYPTDHAPASLTSDCFEERRDAIDLVATLRARTVRIALFGVMIDRPPSDASVADMDRDALLGALREQVRAKKMVRDMLLGKGNFDRFPPSLCTWLVEQASAMESATQKICKMVDLSDQVLQVAENSPADLSVMLDTHFRAGRGGFSDVVTEFCNQLWASLDEQRAQTAQKATQATDAIGDILTRLEYIGKHVRLVSLNASVEAARAGDAGRGLAVIATEFKSLAEEIQTLAVRARAQVETI